MCRANLCGLCLLFMIVLIQTDSSSAVERVALAWHSDTNTAWKATQASNRPMLLFITMSNCSYCEKMKYVTYSDDSVISDIQNTFIPATVEGPSHPKLVEKLGIQVYPTTVIIGPDGRVLESITGYLEPQQLRRRLRLVSSQTR